MTFPLERCTTKNVQKIIENITKKTSKIYQKIVLEAFSNATLKISAKISSKISAKCEFWPPTWPPGKGTRSPFWSHFHLWGTLGCQNGPKTPPKRLRHPSGPDFLVNFSRFSSIVCGFVHRFSMMELGLGTVAERGLRAQIWGPQCTPWGGLGQWQKNIF